MILEENNQQRSGVMKPRHWNAMMVIIFLEPAERVLKCSQFFKHVSTS